MKTFPDTTSCLPQQKQQQSPFFVRYEDSKEMVTETLRFR